jgi:hypothetical protein
VKTVLARSRQLPVMVWYLPLMLREIVYQSRSQGKQLAGRSAMHAHDVSAQARTH